MNMQSTSSVHKRVSRREFLRLSALAVGGAALVSCVPATSTVPAAQSGAAGNAPAAGPVEVSFQHFFDSPELKATFDPIFASIEQETNTKIRSVPTPYADMLTKLLTMTAGGTPPDITSAASDWVKEASGAGSFCR